PYEEREDIINNLLELVDLKEKKDSYVDVLSRGMKQRLCLARSLVHDPDVLILDEPASGLDPRARVEMKEVLKQLKTLGKTIIISSHILPELAELCTEIGIINHGRIVAQGTVNDIMMNISSERVIIIKTMGQRDRLKILLSQIPNVRNITEKVDEVEFGFVGSDAEMQHIISEIVRNGIPLVSFSEKEGNLEDIFMKLTEERGNAV
ncbi:MAG: ABC transporter ATP-binding protein, partial [Firmicutes bacterium]|nr:ABC transporter ATP-binding protein [Bacillota bacterium]